MGEPSLLKNFEKRSRLRGYSYAPDFLAFLMPNPGVGLKATQRYLGRGKKVSRHVRQAALRGGKT